MPANYDEVLADLRQMKADAEAGITAIERLMARGHAPVEPPKRAAQGNTAENDASIPEQVSGFLGGQQGKSFTINEIAMSIGAKNLQSLRGALGRMVVNGKAAKQGRGRYRAPRPKIQTVEPDAA
jgi:hypothetical protein